MGAAAQSRGPPGGLRAALALMPERACADATAGVRERGCAGERQRRQQPQPRHSQPAPFA
eukprot:7786075-Pyramimonas_sp.AAC.1